ncbi:NfeD family protein [Rhodoferax sp.]|uniref:NfeD family protein n=1 Tax=Rhodoferax sp. TaxID=50421 RepID=UPI00272221C2|nr:NfeD family protein [Rhodoferax sp.]MDO9144145.1 NfeD family protein [Rhodoferax sp.]MDP3863235.1 NfeD family protein [Rhodoferax sp.]
MAESTLWWLLAGGMIALELLTGTFYLLMLSLGVAGAAIAAHLGASVTVQLVVAALLGGGCVLAWRSYKKHQPPALPAGANRDVNLDIGETLHIDAWNDDGTSTAKYRGATWSVTLRTGAASAPGLHRIVEVVGSRLMVEKV